MDLPLITPEEKAYLEERFWPKVDKKGPKDCWEWTGTKNGPHYGYGGIRLRTFDGKFNKMIRASRASWMLYYNMWPPKTLFCCHSCDNPPCVNPLHLWLGTNAQNNNDMKLKGRHSHGRFRVKKISLEQKKEILCKLIVEKTSINQLKKQYKCSSGWLYRSYVKYKNKQFKDVSWLPEEYRY